MLTPLEQKKRDALKLHKPLVYDKVMRYDERYARGESVAVVQLQYDYRCNMHCEHCSISGFRRPHDRRALDPESVKDLCDQADAYGLAQIDLTGGEPIIFPDLEEVIAAIGPERFYLMVDTNGWEMTHEKAWHLKAMGVDKVQIGLDNMEPGVHDAFRRKPGSHARALRAIGAVRDAGLVLQVSTVVTPTRVRSDEFVRFLEFTAAQGAVVNSIWAKATGEYAHAQSIVSAEDEALRAALSRKYPHLTPPHTTPHFGVSMGCIAWKKILTVTKYGDVLPCIWIYYSLGNIFEEPLETILRRGGQYFGEFHPRCRTNRDPEFMEAYRRNTAGRDLPVRIEDIWSKATMSPSNHADMVGSVQKGRH
jgi:MoaA/NifB/PqqE/SkfB family radical SAM enzyme